MTVLVADRPAAPVPPQPQAAGIPVSDFATDRLEAIRWDATLADPLSRRALELALPDLLTAPVLRHLPAAMHPEGEIPAWIDARAAECTVFLATGRETGDLLGLLLLAPDAERTARPTVHVGYLLAEGAWGRGLATELLHGLATAIRRPPGARLIAGVTRANVPSARVLEKAGFLACGERSDDDTLVYRRTIT